MYICICFSNRRNCHLSNYCMHFNIFQILQVQQFTHKRFEMSTVQPGRYETLEIYSSSPTAGEKGSSAGSDNDPSLIPRFTLTVVDMGDRPVGYRPIRWASNEVAIHNTQSCDVWQFNCRTCAVFFVPFGREAEYQFTSRAGLEVLQGVHTASLFHSYWTVYVYMYSGHCRASTNEETNSCALQSSAYISSNERVAGKVVFLSHSAVLSYAASDVV